MSLPDLTDRQAQILRFIRTFIASHGYPPSIREIRDDAGYSSSDTAAYQVGELTRKGYIRRDGRRPRALVIVDREGA